MKRRQAVGTMILLAGGAMLGTTSLLPSCRGVDKKRTAITDEDIPLLDEIAETIIPATAGSPGAKQTQVGAYMKMMVNDCFTTAQQQIFFQGLNELEAGCHKIYNNPFMALNTAQKQKFITALDEAAKRYTATNGADSDKDPHYFTLIKTLAVRGFLTSKAGATTVLQYQLVPGKYEGCVAYKKGTPVW